MASTSLDLSQIKTDALSAASTFRTLIGLGNVNNTSDANKPISSATQSALDGKLSLTGGTLTGAVTSNLGTVTTSTPALTINQTWNNAGNTGTVYNLLSSNVSFASNPSFQNQSTYFNFNASGLGGSGTGTGFLRAFIKDGELSISSEWGGGTITLGTIGVKLAAIYGSGLVVSNTSGGSALFTAGYAGRIINHMGSGGIGAGYSFATSGGTFVGDIVCEAANTIVFRNSTNAQTFRLYGTYTDASNYRRLYLSSTTAGAFTLGVEGAGTGVSGNTLAVANDLRVSNASSNSILTISSPSTFSALLSFSSNGGGFQTSFGLTGANNHVFNNTTAGDFAIRSPQNKAIHFGADNGAGNATSSLVLASSGNTGIGTSNPNVALVIRRSGADLPALRLEDGDITVPFTGIGINPTLNANTVGSWSSSASASGGMSFSGFTNNTAASYPLIFEGYTGSASPTKSIISFGGWKTNGGTGATTLASSELLAGFFNGDVSGTPVVSIAANGATAFSGKITATATGNNSGGIGNGDNGVDFFQGVIIYNGQGGTSTAAYPAYFCFGQSTSKLKFHPNTELQWDAGDPTATRNNGDLRIARDAANTLGQRNSTNSQTFRLYNTITDGSNYIRQSLSFTTYSTTVHAQLAAEGAGTGAVNVPFVITPRGTGAFILGPMPDGTATGGNARGAYAIDLQSNLRSAATQVASGLYAVAIGSRNVSSGENTIAIGLDNTSTQYDSVAIGKVNTAGYGGVSIGWLNSAITTGIAIGQGNSCNGDTAVGIGSNNSASSLYANAIGRANTASATRSTAIGTNALSNRFGMYSYADGAFAANGDAQMAMFVLRNKTTDNTATTLFLDGSSTRLTIPSGKLFLFTAKIVGVRSDGLRRASYVRKGTIINVAGATSIVGAIEAVGTDVEDDPNLNITITADDTNDALDIQVTGITGETWRWVAVVEGVEVAYGT